MTDSSQVDKKLVLHFQLDSTVMVNPDEMTSLEGRVNEWLANKKIGTVDVQGDWSAAITIQEETSSKNNDFISYM
jgi:hypothetical protein